MEKMHSQGYTVRNYEVGPHQAAHVRTLLESCEQGYRLAQRPAHPPS